MGSSAKLIGKSDGLKAVMESVDQAARVDLPVLIVGETGTGKEMVAQEIHQRSERSQRPFVAVNTGALPRELVASELFGHQRGAFTGAAADKIGRFEEAHGGTLFLDEITTMEGQVQVSLLRVLETASFRPVGALADRSADVRLLAATNVSPEDAVDSSQFREDLMHRLRVLQVHIPPLRHRREDIPLLTEHFLAELNAQHGLSVQGVAEPAMAILYDYAWPGNIRELRNVIAEAGLAADKRNIEPDDLAPRVRANEHPEPPPAMGEEECERPSAFSPNLEQDGQSAEGIFLPLGARLDQIEKAYVLTTLELCHHNKSQTAKTLGISRKALYDKLRRWEADPSQSGGTMPSSA